MTGVVVVTGSVIFTTCITVAIRVMIATRIAGTNFVVTCCGIRAIGEDGKSAIETGLVRGLQFRETASQRSQ